MYTRIRRRICDTPPASGNQWSIGAVGCSEWTGVRLKDVLEEVGINDDAVYVAYYGADTHASGDPTKVPISRGMPVEKALEDETLIAWAGDRAVEAMHVSIDFGATWVKADLKDPANRFAWQQWNAEIEFPEMGYYEIWARGLPLSQTHHATTRQ